MRTDTKDVKRIFSRILILSLISVFIACAVITIANDMYAFIKVENEITLTVDAPVSLYTLSRMLSDGGIIENPTVFSLYVRSKDKKEFVESFCGTVTLNSTMSYREILTAISTA